MNYTQPTVTVRFETKPTYHQLHQAIKGAGVGAYKFVTRDPNALEVTVQPITLDEIRASLVNSADKPVAPEIQSLQQQYRDLGNEELLVRYEEAVQEMFALFYLVGERSWGNSVVRKVSELIHEKYWGYPKTPQPAQPKTRTGEARLRPQTTLMVDTDELD